MRNSKDWLPLNQNNVSEWSYIAIFIYIWTVVSVSYQYNNLTKVLVLCKANTETD
jgi:hypothetical protein